MIKYEQNLIIGPTSSEKNIFGVVYFLSLFIFIMISSDGKPCFT